MIPSQIDNDPVQKGTGKRAVEQSPLRFPGSDERLLNDLFGHVGITYQEHGELVGWAPKHLDRRLPQAVG